MLEERLQDVSMSFISQFAASFRRCNLLTFAFFSEKQIIQIRRYIRIYLACSVLLLLLLLLLIF